MNILADKVALVTGAGSGIGLAVALVYAKEGAKVVVSDINEQAGQAAVQQIEALGGVLEFRKILFYDWRLLFG